MKYFQDIKACVFDAYGTLFDVHSAVGKHAARLGAQADAVSALWRSKQLEYTWLRSLMGQYVDFWQVTGDALDFALEQHRVDARNTTNAGLRDALMQAYLELSPYSEISSTLDALHELGVRTAILSNGTPAMLEAAVENAQLQESFEAVLSVEAVEIYKPDPRVYQMAVDQLGLAKQNILFLSSNGWDIQGAKAFGFQTLWVNRNGAPAERLGNPPDAVQNNLSNLAEMVA